MFVFLPMTLALPAWGQAAVTGREGQAVTLEDLEGVAVDATTVRQQVGRRNGGPIFSRRVQNDVRLIIRSGKIDWSLTPSAFTPSGIRRGKPRSGSLMIERPGKLDDFSGRDFAVWVFNEGTLWRDNFDENAASIRMRRGRPVS
jgi:hypothetical protein